MTLCQKLPEQSFLLKTTNKKLIFVINFMDNFLLETT